MLIETQYHGALAGLGNDDHTQYVLADGSRSMSSLTCTGTLLLSNDQKLQLGSSSNYIRWNNTLGKLELNSVNLMELYSYYDIAIRSEDDVVITSGFMNITLSTPNGKVKATDLEVSSNLEIGTSGNMSIYDSSGDMYFESAYGFTFDGSQPLQSLGGFMSSSWNAGITQSVDYSGGTMYFEDGLLVYVNIY